ncbi:MAG: Bug family tripartite tricarboxylate transporter substrate binding protein [Candidatus Binatia bacterium]
MHNKLALLIAALYGFAFVARVAAAPAAEEFYRGKTVRFIVGFSAGGGFDTYARTIARHIGKHIPGKPTIVVDNMTGAGSLISANYIYNQAKPDGLTIGHWIGGLIVQQVIKASEGIKFDGRKFEWVGLVVNDNPACVLTKASGIQSLDQWLASKEPIKVGVTGVGSDTHYVPSILKVALGLPMQLIEGYKGTANIRLAAESGELDGGCWAWESLKPTWRKGLQSGDVKPVIQAVPKKHSDMLDVPNAIDYAKTEEARQLLRAGIHNTSAINRSFSLPPGTPKDRVAALQKAFMGTMKDPEFLAEAQKSQLAINPLPGNEVAKIVASFFELKPDIVAKLTEILAPRKR